MKLITILSLSVLTFTAQSQDFKKEIDSTYNFYPHKMSKEEQKRVFPLLDKFFEKIKSDTATYLPLLRQELQSPSHHPYFYYDCSHLLMMISKTQSDLKICADGFSKCDLEDLDPKIYVSLVSYLSRNKVNTTRATMKILSDSSFSFYLPEHAMLFNQGYCLLYCLLPLDPALYQQTLVEFFKSTNSADAQKSIITTLWFAYTCYGDAFLTSLTKSNTRSSEVVEYAKELLNSKRLDKDYRKLEGKMNLEDLENYKSDALKRFSDEAIHDMDFVTKVKRKNYPCH